MSFKAPLVSSSSTHHYKMTELKSKIKVLNIVISVENMLSVYRNYSTLNKWRKILVATKVFLFSLIYVAAFTHYMTYLYKRHYRRDFMLFMHKVLFHVFANSSTLISFVIAIQQSDNFKIIIDYIDRVHACCINESFYPKALRKVILWNTSYLLLLVSNSTINCISVLFYAVDIIKTSGPRPFLILALQLTLALTKSSQFYIQFFNFNILTHVIILALKQINLNLLNVIQNSQSDNDNYKDSKIDCHLLEEILSKSIPIINCLKICSDKLKLCFGIQVSFKLTVFKIILWSKPFY